MSSGTHVQVFGIDVAVTNHNGATFFIPEYANGRPVSRRVREGRHSEPRLHKLVGSWFESVRGSMLHAGTFFGDMLPSFSRKVPGSLYAFEPVLENYLLAWSTVTSNKLDNVLLFHAGLGDSVSRTSVETRRPTEHRGGTSRLQVEPPADDQVTQPVSMLSIDHLAIPDLALLQLDVEGFELPVLQGAVATLERCRPLVVLEDNESNCEPFLKEIGYEQVGVVARSNTVYRASGTELPPSVLSKIG